VTYWGNVIHFSVISGISGILYLVGDSWTTYDWEVDTALNQDKFQGILKLNSSNQPSLYLGVGKNSGPVESIVDIKFRIGQERDWTLDGKFGGPLTYFAEELSGSLQ